MKIAFLDFDGVLNSTQSVEYYYRIWVEKGKPAEEMYLTGENNTWCPIALSNLKILLYRVPDLSLVITSSWRIGAQVQDLRDLFYQHPVISRSIIDVTPVVNNKTRGDEIKQWIKNTPINVEEFVILDDDRDMKGMLRHLVQTNPNHGLMYNDMLKALEILEVPLENEEYLDNMDKLILESRFSE